MTVLRKLLLISALYAWTGALAMADQEDDRRPEQDFLFLLEEGYLQDQGEWQMDATVVRDHDLRTNWRTALGVEYGLTERLQVELSIPFLRLEAKDGSNHSDIGDIEFGLAYAAVRETDILPEVALSVGTSAPSGDADRGFGVDTWRYEFGLAASKELSERLFLHANAAHERVNNGFQDDETFDGRGWLLGAGGVYEFAVAVALAVEYAYERERENSGAETETEHASLLSIGLIYQPFDEFEFGLAGVLGLNDQAPDNSIIFRTQVEW